MKPHTLSVECSKSGRATCRAKSCDKLIPKDSVRIRSWYMWRGDWFYHLPCGMKQFGMYMSTVEEFSGFSMLSEGDQNRVRTAFNRTQEGDWTVQIAPTSQSCCVGCRHAIKSGTVRIGRVKKDDEKNTGGGSAVRWSHAKCLYLRLSSHQRRRLYPWTASTKPYYNKLVGYELLPIQAQNDLQFEYLEVDWPYKLWEHFVAFTLLFALMPLAIITGISKPNR